MKTEMQREYEQLCRIDENPGVQGLAQLGRNAIERVAQLEKELAAAVAERDGLGDYRSEFEPIWDGLQDALEGERQINNYGLGESEVECVRRVLRERDILRARLSAIDAAPTIALTFCHPYSLEEPGQLIARPAKD